MKKEREYVLLASSRIVYEITFQESGIQRFWVLELFVCFVDNNNNITNIIIINIITIFFLTYSQ
jgi:hypothetical protein